MSMIKRDYIAEEISFLSMLIVMAETGKDTISKTQCLKDSERVWQSLLGYVAEHVRYLNQLKEGLK